MVSFGAYRLAPSHLLFPVGKNFPDSEDPMAAGPLGLYTRGGSKNFPLFKGPPAELQKPHYPDDITIISPQSESSSGWINWLILSIITGSIQRSLVCC